MPRRFVYNGTALEDPDPKMAADAVRKYYAGTFSALTNASIVGPTKKDGDEIYEFKASVGTKG